MKIVNEERLTVKCLGCDGDLEFIGEQGAVVHDPAPACAWFNELDPLEMIEAVNKKLRAKLN